MPGKGQMLRRVDELARIGKQAAEIAEIIGMSERAVLNTMAMYRIKPRRPAPPVPAPPLHKLMGGKP